MPAAPMTGILLKIMAVTIFTVMMALIKATSADVPFGEAVFFRSAMAMVVLVVWLKWQGDLGAALRTDRVIGHMARGLAGGSAMGLRFFCLGILTFPEVTVLAFASPLILVIFAAMFLGEKVRAFRYSVVIFGFVGVIIILSPRLQSVGADLDFIQTLAAILMIASAALAALAQVFVRKLIATESVGAIVFYFSLSTTLLSLTTLPFGWTIPPWDAFWMLILAGVLGGIGQICLTACYRYAEASVVAPFDYTSILLALAIGYFFFDELPTGIMLLGAGIVVASGILIIWREQSLKKKGLLGQ